MVRFPASNEMNNLCVIWYYFSNSVNNKYAQSRNILKVFYLHFYHTKYERKTLCSVHISVLLKWAHCLVSHICVCVFSACKSLWFSCHFAIWSLNVWTGWKKAHLAWFIYERLHLGAIWASVLKHPGFICPLTQILAAYKPTDGFTHFFHSAKARDQVTPFPTADRVS